MSWSRRRGVGMTTGNRWCVVDMDDGLLRVEPTRAKAVAWLKGLAGAGPEGRVFERYTYGPGNYEYVVGIAPDDTVQAFIISEKVIRRGGGGVHGIDFSRPWYPSHKAPFERAAER